MKVSGREAGAAIAVPISMRGISKRFGSFEALRKINIEVTRGEFLTLLGPSGSGKTTLLNVLAGFIRPDSGQILVAGRDLVREPPHRRGIGMVFQHYAIFSHMDVFQNVAYPLRIRRVPKDEIRRRVAEALELVSLEANANSRPQALSGGQRQRVALARAIVFQPKILLMDEPLSALDKRLREQMQEELRRLHDALGMTTIYVTHDQSEALNMSDRIAVIDRGELVQLDEPRQLYNRPKSEFVAKFIGDSNCIPLDLREDKLFLGDRPLLADYIPEDLGERPLLVLRPERLMLLTEGAPVDGLNLLEGRVADHSYLGHSALFNIALPTGHTISVRRTEGAEHSQQDFVSGARCRLAIRPGDVILVPSGSGPAPSQERKGS